MSMTRKDYIAFASFLSALRPAKFLDGQSELGPWSDAFVLWINQVRTTADHFAHDNPRFLRAKFYAACGVLKGEL
jgi:hypothetical protein